MEQLDTRSRQWKSGWVPANVGINVDNNVSQIDFAKEFLIEVQN